jgi:uncharacterized membrane protein YvlD (DUF360 family)
MVWLRSLSGAVIVLALLCWMVAPFFTKLPISAKILLSLGSFIVMCLIAEFWVAGMITGFGFQVHWS